MFFIYGIPATLATARKEYPQLPPRIFDKYLGDYGIQRDPVNDLVDLSAIHCAISLMTAKQLYLDRGDSWYEVYSKVDTKKELHGILKDWTRENFDADEYFPLKPTSEIMERLREMRPTGVKIEAAPLEEKKRTSKYELAEITKAMYPEGSVRIYCKDCRSKEYKTKTECRHPVDRKRYSVRFYVPGEPDRPPIRKMLDARFVDEAIVELRNIYKALRESSYNTTDLIETKKEGAIVTLSDAIIGFKAYKRNNNDTVRVKQGNDEKYLDSIDKACDILEAQLKKIGYAYFPLKMLGNKQVFRQLYENLESYKVTKEDKELKRVKATKKVGERLYGDVTINGFTTIWSMLCKWLTDEKKLSVSNPFKGSRIPVDKEPVAMDDEQFEELLVWMKKNPKLEREQAKRVSPCDMGWLRCAFLMQARFDLRLKDLVLAKWTDFQYDERRNLFLFRSLNHKVTKKKKAGNKYRYAAVEKEIVKALGEENFKEKAGILDDYILLDAETQAARVDRRGKPIKSIGRDRVQRKISQGFGELCRVLFGKDFELSNKSLRKLNMTSSGVENEDAWKRSHQSKKVFIDSYFDPQLAAKKKGTKNEKVYKISK